MEKVEHKGNYVVWTFHTGNVYTIPFKKDRKILEAWNGKDNYEKHIIKSLEREGEK